MKNQVQLVTYADRLSGGGLRELRALLTGPLAGLFGGVHILPFFEPIDGADAGFDPIDHTRVDPRLGDWSDITALAADVDVMADVIVNHTSADSPQFKDFLARGDASDHRGLFLTFDTVFPNGAAEADLLAVYRPRSDLPLTCAVLGDGRKKILWTTFTPQQIDIDVRHPEGRAYLSAILATFAGHAIRMVRLDAVGYAVKTAGTNCFMTADTFEFIDAFSAEARGLGIEVLVEVHAHHRRQIEIARHVDWVYDFALPPLVLHALFFETAVALKAWIGLRPRNALNVLDTHDGIGVIDIGAETVDGEDFPGLVPAHEIDGLVERIHRESGGQSREASGTAASNLDLYQVNCSFYDALGRDDERYLLARAIQFFLPGVPQVYYVGLLAGGNDMALLARTGVGRDINRRRYAPGEAQRELTRPVVQRLFELIRLRNRHPAFAGEFVVEPGDDASLVLRWTYGSDWATLRARFSDAWHELQWSAMPD